MVRVLHQHGVDINDNSDDTALTRAASEGYKELVQLLLQLGADKEAVDSEGWTHEHCAKQ
jgi:ankyrin repeat protein